MKAVEWVIENWYFFACIFGLLAVIWSNYKDIRNVRTHLDDAWDQIEAQDKRVRDLEISAAMNDENRRAAVKLSTDVDEIKNTLNELVGELRAKGVYNGGPR
jgi:hypothetical protein